jgi:RNA-binding protein YhbY
MGHIKKITKRVKYRRYGTIRIQIGKNGLTDSVIQQIKKVSLEEEMIKITILKSACRDKDEAKIMCDNLVEKLGKNYTYKLIGYVCTLFRFRKNIR